MENITERIADFVFETKCEGIPKDVVEIAKWHILDTVGCILAGSQEEAASIIMNYIRDFGFGG